MTAKMYSNNVSHFFVYNVTFCCRKLERSFGLVECGSTGLAQNSLESSDESCCYVKLSEFVPIVTSYVRVNVVLLQLRVTSNVCV